MQNDISIPDSTSSTIKLLQISIAVAGVWLLLQGWVWIQQQGKLLLQQQSTQLTQETLVTLSHTAAYLIENDQLDGLEQLTQHIAQSPYLHDVVVYDANGVRLSESSGSEPARLLYAPQHKVELQPMVQEIYQGKQLLGYIKISLKQDTGFNAVSSAWHAMMEQVLWMLALAALVVSSANVLLLDEPTNNLDPASRAEILGALAEYQGSVIMVSHDEGAVQALKPERVILLPDGDEDLWKEEYFDLVAID